MDDEKKHQFEELIDEIEMILSIKDDISKDEIENLLNKFHMLSENEIRQKIYDITKNDAYISGFEDIDNAKSVHDEKDRYVDEKDCYVNDEVQLQEGCQTNLEENSLVISECKEEQYIDEDNMPEVSFIRGEIKYGQLLLEWDWKDNCDKVLICYRMDKFPSGPKDSSSVSIVANKEDLQIGNYIINKVSEGNYYFSIYTMKECNEKVIFSKGQRRLISNKEPLEIYYEIKKRKNIFGKIKTVDIVFSTDEDKVDSPQLVLTGKIGNMPIQKSDGVTILKIDYTEITKDSDMVVEIPAYRIEKNMYVKLFFLDDSNSKLYRIVSPSKENLHFK